MLDEAALFKPETPSSVRIAYGTFFCVQVIIFANRVFRLVVSPGTEDLLHWSAYTEIVSLGTLLLVARDLSVEWGLGARLLLVFLLHNSICLAMTLHRLSDIVLQGGFDMGGRLLDIVMVLMYLFWIASGAITLQQGWTYR